MKKTLRGYLLGFLSASLLLTGVVYAASNTKNIEVIFNNIKVYKDNVLCELKDANGSVIEPFVYNGTTYLPVRATANLAGMDVTWNGETQSVCLWDENTANDTYLLDVCMPYEVDFFHTHRSSEGQSFKMGGQNYSNGLETTYNAYALFNLDSKYSTLNCVVGHTDKNMSEKVVNFIVDGKTVKTVELESGCLPKNISVPLNKGLQLKIVTNVITTNSYTHVGIGNMLVK